MPTLYLTTHARLRSDEMGIELDEIQDALVRPELTYPNALGHPAGTTHVRDRIAVPVTADGAVLTVLWHGREGR